MSGWNKDTAYLKHRGDTEEHLRRISDFERKEEEVQSLRSDLTNLEEKITLEIMKLREELRTQILEDFSTLPGRAQMLPHLGATTVLPGRLRFF